MAMSTEEILMRISVDAQGVVSGMARVGSLIKGQAALIVNDLKGFAGRWLGVIGLERGFETIKEKILAVKRASEETGFSTNFVQGAFNKLAGEGENYEEVLKPLTLLAGKTSDAKKFIGDLADQYVHLNTQEERNAMLMNLGIKNWQSLIPLLADGRAGIEALDQGNFFTKISPSTIENFSSNWKILRQTGNDLTAFGANTLNVADKIIGVIPRLFGFFQGEGDAAKTGAPDSWTGFKKNMRFVLTGDNSDGGAGDRQAKLNQLKEQENKIGADGFTIAERRAQVEEEITKQQEERAHLQNSINDRDKLGVDELAERARKLMGTSKMPRGLNSIYTLTPALTAAYNIQNLEDQSKVAQAYGNPALADRLQSQADRLRAQTPALKSTERYPIEKTQEQIAHLDANLKLITDKLGKFPIPP
jgi:hypothetical protein